MTRNTLGPTLAALLIASPALAHGHDGSSLHPAPMDWQIAHDTRGLDHQVNRLNNDVARDNRTLTQDQQRLNTLKIQAAEAKYNKAPPLTRHQQEELAELQRRIGYLNRDITRDNEHITTDDMKLKDLP